VAIGEISVKSFASFALLSVRTLARREDFGLRWQPAEAKRSEDWSTAATPLFDCGPGFQSGVAPALRDSRRQKDLVAATPRCILLRQGIVAKSPGRLLAIPNRFPQKWQTNGNNSQARVWVPN
jgi:hypothetical protein